MKRKNDNKIAAICRLMIYIFPGILFFSYYPLIHFGSNNSMNFEISLPLIWLALFDVLAFFLMIKEKKIGELFRNWKYLLLPIYLTITILWSLNSLRGLLTAGIFWLIYFAGFSIWQLKDNFKEMERKKVFLRFFFGSSLIICFWLFLQCFLDVFGISREYSLLCPGCTSYSFGFPHPNGFAIEPQFMGNLLLAPIFMVVYLLREKKLFNKWFLMACLFVFSSALFLTFSRGAIYAFIVSMIIFTALELIKTKKWKVMLIWPVVVLSFLFVLNLQGIFSELSPVNDNYRSGVAKVLNHLSLGIIDVREKNDNNESSSNIIETQNSDLEVNEEVAPIEANDVANEPVFNGYVAESTDTRLRLSGAAIEVWSKDFKTVMFGVGLGGAGEALYKNNLSPAPKEIVQNQFISLLLEVGLFGVIILIYTLLMVFHIVVKGQIRNMIISLIIAYLITLLFFSGLPNALHIYLLPIMIMAVFNNKEKKLN